MSYFVFKQPKSPYESHISRHNSKPLKNIVKVLETMLQSSKNAQNIIFKKNHDVDKSTLLFGFL